MTRRWQVLKYEMTMTSEVYFAHSIHQYLASFIRTTSGLAARGLRLALHQPFSRSGGQRQCVHTHSCRDIQSIPQPFARVVLLAGHETRRNSRLQKLRFPKFKQHCQRYVCGQTCACYSLQWAILVCPHAAFRDPLAPAEARPRESVECLAIVVYPPSDSEDGQDVHEEVSKAFSDRSRADESRHYPNWDYRSFPRT